MMSKFIFVVAKDGEQIVINLSNITKGYVVEENDKFYPVVECGGEIYYVGWDYGDKKPSGFGCWDDTFTTVWRNLPISEDWDEQYRERNIQLASKILQGLLASGDYPMYGAVEQAAKLAERLLAQID